MIISTLSYLAHSQCYLTVLLQFVDLQILVWTSTLINSLGSHKYKSGLEWTLFHSHLSWYSFELFDFPYLPLSKEAMQNGITKTVSQILQFPLQVSTRP